MAKNRGDGDLPLGLGAFGGQWRRWRCNVLGRSSSAPQQLSPRLENLGDFADRHGFEEVLRFYPRDTPLALFTSLHSEDLHAVHDPELRKRVTAAVQAARLLSGSRDEVDCTARRSLDVDCAGLGFGPRPRSAFIRQVSDDLRRRRETYAGVAATNSCYSPLASSSSSSVSKPAMSHRHSMAIIIGSGGVAAGAGGAASMMTSSSVTGGDSNLVRIRNSTLGQSAPSLTATACTRDLMLPRRCSRGAHRKSLLASTSPTMPRCHSPMSQGSPLESPRNMSPSLQHHHQFAFVPIKKAECRRWSVASLPSSGYGTTPASSNVSSQCSSQERLNHLPTKPTAEQMRILSRHFSSNESNPGADDVDVAAAPSDSASAPPPNACSGGGSHSGCRSPLLIRPRSRSLSSPVRSPVVDCEVVMMNMMYKERFPKATRQMEERLLAFIAEPPMDGAANDLSQPIPADAIAIVRFVQHQVMELARDCLHKSQQQLVTSRYFYEMSDNLEKLLTDARDKSADAVAYLGLLVRRLLLIISRPARLLECLEFDPEQFYHMLEEVEGQARITQGVTDFPQYIVSQLGLNRDPMAELQQDLSQLEQSCSRTPPPSLATAAEDDCKVPSSSGMKTSTPNQQRVKDLLLSDLPQETDYQIVKLISNGAYGAVYLVRHCVTRQRFAMKKINKHNMLLRNQIEQAFAERDILCFADNPFVVSLQCTFETKKHLCMVMEYVEGGDCATLLKNMGPFPCDMARFYFSETVLAVEYLHSYGIVHRDLKPDNLLITTLGHIKLTDFGLSKMGLMSLATNLYEGFIDRETRQFSDKQVFGTPEYIAPEVVLRQGYGKPVDWWAMGIILYEFLIGCVPFFGETPEELFSHVVNDDIEWPSESDWPVDADAKDLITSLLQQNPRDRLGTAGGGCEVKLHPFFDGVDWNSLLRRKAEFIPQLDDDEDTSFFDTRADRYCHDVSEDTDDLDEAPLFGSFSSCSPRYKKSHGLFLESKDGRLSADSGGASDQSELSGIGTPPPAATPPPATAAAESMAAAQGSSVIVASSAASAEPESSPQLQRRRRLHRELKSLPRFTIFVDSDSGGGGGGGGGASIPTSGAGGVGDHIRELSPVEESAPDQHQQRSQHQRCDDSGGVGGVGGVVGDLRCSIRLKTSPAALKTRSRSTGSCGLSLMIPPESASAASSSADHGVGGGEPRIAVQSPGGSSTASSRDTSPCRELSPMITSLKPAMVLGRGARGFGFTVRAIRVYLGDSDFYTLHHLVMAVDEASPAFDAGLRPGDLITHINGEPVQGLFHTQVLQLLLSEGDRVTLRATALDQTSIRTGGRRREPAKSRLARRAHHRMLQAGHSRRPPGGRPAKGDKSERHRKTSLFRRLSNKRASAEIQQQSFRLQSPLSAPVVARGCPSPFLMAAGAAGCGASSPVMMTASRSFPFFSRSLPSSSAAAPAVDSAPNSPTRRVSSSSPPASAGAAGHGDSTASSSPNSSTSPNSPAGAAGLNPLHHASFPHRPSSLHGLKNKLHSVAKNAHSGSRRKSAGHIPLSPLARTPSPSPQPPTAAVAPASPTRSPSPLAFPLQPHHQQGGSNSTQVFSPGALAVASGGAKSSAAAAAAGFGGARPKSAEPCYNSSSGGSSGSNSSSGSPLLRRALSPERLHPRSAEKNLAISPLCHGATGAGVVPKVTVICPPRTVTIRQSAGVAPAAAAASAADVTILTAAAAASAELRRRRSPVVVVVPRHLAHDP